MQKEKVAPPRSNVQTRAVVPKASLSCDDLVTCEASTFQQDEALGRRTTTRFNQDIIAHPASQTSPAASPHEHLPAMWCTRLTWQQRTMLGLRVKLVAVRRRLQARIIRTHQDTPGPQEHREDGLSSAFREWCQRQNTRH